MARMFYAGAFYLRLVGKPLEVYQYLEPLYNDYRKVPCACNRSAWVLLARDSLLLVHCQWPGFLGKAPQTFDGTGLSNVGQLSSLSAYPAQRPVQCCVCCFRGLSPSCCGKMVVSLVSQAACDLAFGTGAAAEPGWLVLGDARGRVHGPDAAIRPAVRHRAAPHPPQVTL